MKARWAALRMKAANGQSPIGPPWMMTASEMAERARNDPTPLRAPKGGTFTAERYPEVLRRQYRELLEFTSAGAGGASAPPWLVYGACAVLVVVLAAAGWFVAPIALGMSTGVVKVAGGAAGGYAPALGGLLGLLVGAGLTWYFRRSSGIALGNGDSVWRQVYAVARITQIEYRNPGGRLVNENAVDAERVVVRRLRTWLMRMAFADREEGVFVSGGLPLLGDAFLNGEIRIETARDLSRITHPRDLYDGRPLTGRWMGVNSIRWFVGLREPIVTGKETAEYDAVEDWEQSARRRLIGNYGFWMMAAGFVVGLLIFFNQLDVQEKDPEPVDRTPSTAAAEVR